jgi:hypothetical protein
MKSKYVPFVAGLISWTLLMPLLVHAQDPTIMELNKIIKSKVDEISTWNSLAQMLAMLTLAVAVLGAISGIMSQVTSKWSKIVIAVAGGCVAIITAYMNMSYAVDYRTYKKLTYEARAIVDDINIQMLQLREITDKAKLTEIINTNIWPKLQKIIDIGKQLNSGQSNSQALGTRIAYAQEMSPPWVTKPPKEKNTLYFVGHGVANTPESAEKLAVDYTKETARIAILDTLVESGQKKDDPSNTRIVKSILDSSEVIKKFVKYDAQQKTYRYFCLLKIDIEIIQFRLQLLKAGENISTPEKFISDLQKESAP